MHPAPAIRSAASAIVVLLAALLMSVGPIGLLQLVAWTGMAFDYSARYGLAEGFQRTFDGKHPCPLCKQIAKARQGQKDSKQAVAPAPIKLSCAPASVAATPRSASPCDSLIYFDDVEIFTVRSSRPASPPPRTPAA